MLFFSIVSSPAPIHGNPGDYAWGPAGLDNIITRLLNQLDDRGSPPAKKELVDALPVVKFSGDNISTSKYQKLNGMRAFCPSLHYMYVLRLTPSLTLYVLHSVVVWGGMIIAYLLLLAHDSVNMVDTDY